MGFPVSANLTRRINKEAFYAEIDAAKNERIYPMISEAIPQDVASVIRPGMGAIPKPIQLSGTNAGMSGARVKQLKDYEFTTTVVEWDLSIEMPRSTIEDLPEEVARIGRNHGGSATVYFDERMIAQLDSTTANGYDSKPLYSTTHDESGTNQDNARTDAVTDTLPDVGELETALDEDLVALRNFTDDQGRPVNEGASGWLILIPPEYEYLYRGVLDPTLSAQAIDASGATGRFRGLFDIRVSAYIAGDRHFIFAKSRNRKALGFFEKTAWDYNSNIGTDSDAWQHGRTAIFSGYARFEFLPWDWKTTVRHVFT